MNGSDDDTMLDPGRKVGIDDLLKRAAARRDAGAAKPPPAGDPAAEPDDLPSMDRLTPLPKPGDPYKAYARPANQPVPSLHLLAADGQIWTFPYSGRVEGPHRLAVEGEPGRGTVMVLRFAASVAVETVIAGTNLDDLHVYLADHRIRWIRELPPDRPHKDDGAPAVRSILVRPLVPKMLAIWPIVQPQRPPARTGRKRVT